MEDQALEQAVDVAALLLAAAVGVLIGLAVGAIIVVAVRIVLRRHPHVRRIMRRCRKPLATALAGRLRSYLSPGGILVLGARMSRAPGFRHLGHALYQAV